MGQRSKKQTKTTISIDSELECSVHFWFLKTKQQQTQEAKNSFGKDQYVHHFLNFQITTYLLPECSIQGPPCTSAVCKMCFLPLSSVLLAVLG